MKRKDWFEIWAPLVLLIVVFVIVCLFCRSCTRIHDENAWNNGVCSCGGKYEYQQAVGHYYSTDYIYKCNKCGDIIELSKLQKEEK